MHMEHGGKPYFFPRVPPFRPVCCIEACGTQCGSLSYRARTVSRPGGKRYGLNARCHSAAPNILGAVAAPLCSDSLPRPLRARHRRASPRVLENAQGCSAQLLRHVLWNFRSAWHTGCHRPFTVFPVFAVFMVSLFPPCALHNVLCQPTEHTALCLEISTAHGTHCTKCQSSDKSDRSDKSDILCPQYRHCTKCPCQPTGFLSVFSCKFFKKT